MGCQIACIHPKPVEIQQTPEDAASQRKTGLSFYQQYLSFEEEPALLRWQLGGEQVPETLLLWDTSQHTTTASTSSAKCHLKYMALFAMYSYTDHIKQMADITWRCMGKRKKNPCKGVFSAPSLNESPLWYVSLPPHVTQRWLLHNLLLTHIFSVPLNNNSFSAHKALGRSISNNLNMTHLPRTWVLWPHARNVQETEMQLLPKGKNCAWGVMV